MDKKLARLKKIIAEDVYVRRPASEIQFSTDHGNTIGWIFDFRRSVLNPEHIDLIAEIFWEKYESQYPFQVCGLEVAAIPFVTAIVMKSVQRGKPVNGFFIRKSRKKHGLLRMIEGKVTNDNVIIVDDIINSGATVVRQLDVLDELGIPVTDVFMLMHFRELEYYYFLKERGITLTSFFPISDFADREFVKNKPKPRYLGHTFLREWYFKSDRANFRYVVPKSTPALDHEKVYFGADNGYFWALNQSDGSVAWNYKVGRGSKGKSIFSAPALHNNLVYFGSYDGNVYALDRETGKRQWIFMEADWIGSSPAVAADLGLLFIGLEFGLIGKQGGIAALDLKTGEKKWDHITPALTHGSPAYCPGKQVVAIGSNDSKVYMYDARTGKLKWSLQTRGEVKASFVFDEQRNIVAFQSFDGNLYIVDIHTGKVKFTYPTEFGTYSTPVIDGGTIYFSALDKRLYSVNLDTGMLNWKFKTNGRIFASPVVIDNKVYVGSNDGRLYEIDPETGLAAGFFQATERITNKIVYNEKTRRFFLPTFANELYCLSKNRFFPTAENAETLPEGKISKES